MDGKSIKKGGPSPPEIQTKNQPSLPASQNSITAFKTPHGPTHFTLNLGEDYGIEDTKSGNDTIPVQCVEFRNPDPACLGQVSFIQIIAGKDEAILVTGLGRNRGWEKITKLVATFQNEDWSTFGRLQI